MANPSYPRTLEATDPGTTRKEAEDREFGDEDDRCSTSKRKNCDSDNWRRRVTSLAFNHEEYTHTLVSEIMVMKEMLFGCFVTAQTLLSRKERKRKRKKKMPFENTHNNQLLRLCSLA